MSTGGVRRTIRLDAATHGINAVLSIQSGATLRLGSSGSRMKRSLPSVPTVVAGASSRGSAAETLDTNGTAFELNNCTSKTSSATEHYNETADESTFRQQSVTSDRTVPRPETSCIDDVRVLRDRWVGATQLRHATDHGYHGSEADDRNRLLPAEVWQNRAENSPSELSEKQNEYAKRIDHRYHRLLSSENSLRRPSFSDTVSLYDIMCVYEMRRLTLVTLSTETGRGCSVSLLDEFDVIEVNAAHLVSGCFKRLASDVQPDRILHSEREATCENGGRSDGDDVTLISIASVSNRLVAIESSRGLAIGDVLIEVNGHYVVGCPAGEVRQLLAAVAVEPLRVVVATRRDDHVYPPPTSFHRQDQSAKHRHIDNAAVRRVSSSEFQSGFDLWHSDTILSTSAIVTDPTTNARYNSESSIKSPNRRQSDGIPERTLNGDEISNRKRRSMMTLNDKSNAWMIDNGQRMRADNEGHHRDRYDTSDNDERRGSDQITHPSEVANYDRNHVTTHRKHPAKTINRDDVTMANGKHPPEVFASGVTVSSRKRSSDFGSVQQVRKSPHPKWLTAVIEERSGNSAMTSQDGASKLMGFIPLTVSTEDDVSSDVSETGSDGSLVEEAFYDDFYGWQCVSAV